MENRSDGKNERRRSGIFAVLQLLNTPTLHSLFMMWTSPRMMVVFAVTMVVQMLARLSFLPVQMIPRHLDFQPGIILVPLSAVFFGPAGVWGSLAASLLGDKLFGQWNALSWYRAASFFFFALGTMRLWDVAFRRDAPPPELSRTWVMALRFTFVAWPGCFLAAAWRAIGSELSRAYPFAYIVSLLVLNNLLFCTLFGSVFYELMAGSWVARFGDWRAAMGVAEAGGRTSVFNGLLIAAASLGACVAGLYVSSAVYHIGPLQPFMLGASTGRGVPGVVLPLLLVQAWAVLRRD